MEDTLINTIIAVALAFVISLAATPLVRRLAIKIGAMDIPKDNRRMHKVPMPLIGGLAIFISFVVTCILFMGTNMRVSVYIGAAIIVILGIFDDIYDIKAVIKFIVQIIAALTLISDGVLISSITVFGVYVNLGWLSYPITVFWIVALVNAFNLIDGLDGLSCGMCAICCVSLFAVGIVMGNYYGALPAAILFGSCMGFLPYNFYPAKIFMGDTGAYFLGYIMAVISIEGVFKMSAVISFLLPIIIFALPLFDTAFAFIRRILEGEGPFTPDKKHLHHRLIEAGLSQKQAVGVLYSICAFCGIVAVISTDAILSDLPYMKWVILFAAAAVTIAFDYVLSGRRKKSGNKKGKDAKKSDRV
ncbi:MAG: undecaprenyl/decaprenyl-phosphate alpha-N-acetylglucosaminyl 1-phosphate transferase [Firmicutes bacterium]|nr:undecaprenyl/decaprenyl-phosphate alpha-N-acetylglucosaminyl 1-phosphate transferase [Bacillota bacterium]